MDRKTTLIQRFSLLCLFSLVLFGLGFGWMVTENLENSMVKRARRITAEVVREAVIGNFVPSDFDHGVSGEVLPDFQKRVRKLSLGPDVVRIKIWNPRYEVVWSDDPAIVGRRFEDNEELREAINGEVVSELSVLQKAENIRERGFNRLLELYVPINFEGGKDANPEVIFEIYQNLDPLYEDISIGKRSVWTFTALGFGFLYLLLFGIVWRASKQIESQTEQIVRAKQRYEGLVQSAQDGIVCMDTDGKITLFNKAAEKIFKWPAREVIGKSPDLFIARSEDRKRHNTGVKSFLKNDTSSLPGKTFQLEALRKSGESFPIELSLSVSGKGKARVVTAIIRDISERKAIEKHLLEMERQNSISIIAGSIGHELNNAVTGLLGYSELIKTESGNRNLIKEAAGVFGTQCQRLKLHANNLLALSKPPKPKVEPVDITAILDNVTEMLVASGVLKAYTIQRKYEKNLAHVLGDENLLEQIIRNLEINSAHAMDNGGVLTLGAHMVPDQGFVEFFVADNGQGIPEEKLEWIFLPFFTTKEEGRGSGLGMYIVKEAVNRHEGYINVESQVGVGTKVTIGIPSKTRSAR